MNSDRTPAPSRERAAAWLLGALALAASGVALYQGLSEGERNTAPPGEAIRWRAAREARLRAGLAGLARLGPAELKALAYSPERHLALDALADCVTEERVGRRGDGGKWICNGFEIHKPCLAYGVGAGPEITFEQEMASRYGCEVHIFDPSPGPAAAFAGLSTGRKFGEGTVTFHPWGLGPVSRDPAKARELVIDGKACEVKTLDEMAAALGHAAAKIDVLKIDIEGSEFAVLEDLLRRKLLEAHRVDQLLVEFHTRELEEYTSFVQLHGQLTNAGFLLFRKELNPIAAEAGAEYAFARMSFLLD